jgi:quercetin dioxygenase-like cupin family protein
MKASLAACISASFVAVGTFTALPAFAIDLVEAAPRQTKVLLDNDRVRVIEIKVAKGDKIPMHSHPDYVVYVIKAGRVKWTMADGKTMETTGKDGDVTYRTAVTHAHEHPDASHAIVVELKK